MSGRNNDQCVDLGAQQAPAGTVHKPFSWVHTDTINRGTSFIESVVDLCAGLHTCLQLVHSTDLALHARAMDDDEAVPLLGIVDKERLLRLAIAVTGNLANSAHQEIEWINDQARRAVKESAR